jgi:DNA-binding NarL/FixJ family response regulator
MTCANAKILLVDNDAAFRRMLRDLIRRHFPHAIVHEAHGPEDAVRKIKSISPGLVLAEIDMAGRRSLDLTRKMNAVHPESVIAILTSYDLPEYREAAFQAGAHHFISKSMPTTVPVILAIVEEALDEAPCIPATTAERC